MIKRLKRQPDGEYKFVKATPTERAKLDLLDGLEALYFADVNEDPLFDKATEKEKEAYLKAVERQVQRVRKLMNV